MLHIVTPADAGVSPVQGKEIPVFTGMTLQTNPQQVNHKPEACVTDFF